MNDAERPAYNLAVGPLIASLGALLLIVSLFLDWYERDVEAFTVFEFIDLLLLFTALGTIAALIAGMGLLRPAPPPGVALGLSVLALIVVVSQILNDPPAVAFNDDIGKEIGIWLALSGSAVMVAGSVLGFARISLAVDRRPPPRAGDDRDPTRPLGDPRPPQR
jgi:peptidoglycan/LPS O-acetylase OafA/YrhL